MAVNGKQKLYEGEIERIVYGLVPGEKGDILILKEHAIGQLCDIMQRAFYLGYGAKKLEKYLNDKTKTR